MFPQAKVSWASNRLVPVEFAGHAIRECAAPEVWLSGDTGVSPGEPTQLDGKGGRGGRLLRANLARTTCYPEEGLRGRDQLVVVATTSMRPGLPPGTSMSLTTHSGRAKKCRTQLLPCNYRALQFSHILDQYPTIQIRRHLLLIKKSNSCKHAR